MTQALTETVWRATLQRIITANPDDTTRTLAAMLYDIIEDPTDIGDVLDTYGSKLLGPLP